MREKHADGGQGAQAHTALVVLAWFVLNISMASLTKWLFLYGLICVPEDGCVAYRYPLAITVVHMLFSWAMCGVQLRLRGGVNAVLSLRQQLDGIAPLAACFALSVAMGNLSLKYIYPSFNQMLGAMSPLITVLMAACLQQKRYNFSTWVSMPIICGGLCVCSYKEVNFDLLGALFATGATVLRAAKSIMQGKLLAEKLDSVTLLYSMAPWAALLLLALSLVLEGVDPARLLLRGFLGAHGAGYVFLLLCVSGLNACLLNVTNFLVTFHTNPVTLQVLGNVKSCLSIGISVAIFRNDLQWEQAMGVVTCLFGVWFYNSYGGDVKLEKLEEQSAELCRLPAAATLPGKPDVDASGLRCVRLRTP